MKKKYSKLTLNRETVDQLTRGSLLRAAGADTGVSGCLECPPPSDYTCWTCPYYNC